MGVTPAKGDAIPLYRPLIPWRERRGDGDWDQTATFFLQALHTSFRTVFTAQSTADA